MKLKEFCLSIVFLVGLATVSGAQTMGTLTENSVSMDVKAAVAVLGDGPALTVYLLPFQPTPEETAQLQAGETMWLLRKASPDVKKWKNGTPFGHFKLGWGMHPEAAGDTKKATVLVHSYSVGTEGSNPNATSSALTFPDADRSSKEGQEVAVTSKGSRPSARALWPGTSSSSPRCWPRRRSSRGSYSERSATVASTRLARRAGSKDATPATRTIRLIPPR
jgi:hypothetical protein